MHLLDSCSPLRADRSPSNIRARRRRDRIQTFSNVFLFFLFRRGRRGTVERAMGGGEEEERRKEKTVRSYVVSRRLTFFLTVLHNTKFHHPSPSSLSLSSLVVKFSRRSVPDPRRKGYAKIDGLNELLRIYVCTIVRGGRKEGRKEGKEKGFGLHISLGRMLLRGIYLRGVISPSLLPFLSFPLVS